MVEFKATERAIQKYQEIVNGSKKELDAFFNSVTSNKIDRKLLKKLGMGNTDGFYSRKCKNVYALVVERENDWFLVDILIKKELDDLTNKH